MTISVLVVEDDVEIRETVRLLLEDAGYFVHCVDSSDEAMDLLGRIRRPCILLWDAMTPRHSLSMVDRATLDGVHVATLPISIATTREPGSTERRTTKQLTSESAILSIVREHCPLPESAIA